MIHLVGLKGGTSGCFSEDGGVEVLNPLRKALEK